MIITEVYDANNTLLAELTGKFKTRRISHLRNSYDVITLGFDLDEIYRYCRLVNTDIETLFAVGKNLIKMRKNGVVLGVGEISLVSPSVQNDGRTLSITANGWFYKFDFRYSPGSVTYTGQDAGQVAWDLINATQSTLRGDLGITQGIIQPSFMVNELYEYKKISDAIVTLSEANDGFDFEITPDKVFNVWYPKIGRRRTDISLTYPGNILEIPFERDGTKIVNRVIEQGAGSGSNSITVIVEDIASQNQFGIRELINIRNDLNDVDALTADAQGLLSVQKNFIDMPQVVLDGGNTPQYGSYQLGDEIQLVCEYVPLKPFSDWYRIDQINVDIDENDYEQVTLTLVRVV